MSADIVHAYEWDTPENQYFVTLGFGRDEVGLYRMNADEKGAPTVTKEWAIQDFGSIQCYDYSRTHHGLAGIGLHNGMVQLFELSKPNITPIKISPKHQRPCNAIAFNSTGLLAVGFDRVRNEESLLLYDVHAEGKIETSELAQHLANEAVSCLQFIPSRPTALLCGSYKNIREMDTRTSSASHQIPTKYTNGISVNRLNDNQFLSYSETGALALWDRRQLTSSSSATGEPVMLVPRVFNDARSKGIRCVHFSQSSMDEFGALHDGSLIRRWVTGTIPGGSTSVSHLSSAVNPQAVTDSLFVRCVRDLKTEYDKVVAFDYCEHPVTKQVDFVCIRQSGQVFRMPSLTPPENLHFDPFNSLLVADEHNLNVLTAAETTSAALEAVDLKTLDEDLSDEGDSSSEEAESEHELIMSYKDTLYHDIAKVMQLRALKGYGCDPTLNLEVLGNETAHLSHLSSLRNTWNWMAGGKALNDARLLETETLDLSYCGVWSLWEGVSTLKDQTRTTSSQSTSEKQLESAVTKTNAKFDSRVFVSPAYSNDDRAARRQLCLRAAGWDFGLSELEGKLEVLEANGQHEKAAGWAVFHGNVERAVESLAKSRKGQLRLMSSAVAGYLVYKDVDANNPWREQCRKLASEMSMPYLRAIFAYIADGSWSDVLDDHSLPLIERLGIALRFLPDKELARYLTSLTDWVVRSGDLEGIILTGQTPRLVDLLQSFLDKTGDVQTAALIISFGYPRFFSNMPQVDGWIEAYRHLLNTWKYFSQRARFDVGRNKLATRLSGIQPLAPIPKQAILRCIHCKAVIGQTKTGDKETYRTGTRCPNCNFFLPRCAVCLLPLGGTNEEHSKADRWPVFCLTCGHGFHTTHAREWFDKYSVCPVPECQCLCGQML